MNALDEYIKLSLHTYEWGEMSLVQQAELQEEATAELAALRCELDEAKHIMREIIDLARTRLPINGYTEEQWAHRRLAQIAATLVSLLEKWGDK